MQVSARICIDMHGYAFCGKNMHCSAKSGKYGNDIWKWLFRNYTFVPAVDQILVNPGAATTNKKSNYETFKNFILWLVMKKVSSEGSPVN